MSVLVVVTRPESAAPVIRWGARLAIRAESPLKVLCCIFDTPHFPSTPAARKPELTKSPLVRQAAEAMGDLQGVEVEHLAIGNTNPAQAIIKMIQENGVETLCVDAHEDIARNSPAWRLARNLSRFAPCNKLLLDTGDSDARRLERILLPMGKDQGRQTIQAAAKFAEKLKCQIVPLKVGSNFGLDSHIIAQRSMAKKLEDAGLKPGKHVRPTVTLKGRVWPAIVDKSRKSDLVVFSSISLLTLARFRKEEKKLLGTGGQRACIGTYITARETRGQYSVPHHIFKWLPTLKLSERIDLFDRLRAGARWNIDFILMIGLSTAIASMGLMQNSTAVVIGAMVVAPLMTPLIGSGLALVQGNFLFFRDTLRTMGYGVTVCLVISALVGLVVPMEQLTPELLARGGPTLIDMAVAFLSGIAASYAMARPSLLGALAGVAIATALVPPLSTVGIALVEAQWHIAQGAAILFLTNLIAIILGAATIYSGLGIQGSRVGVGMPLWVGRTIMGLVFVALLLTAPLWNELSSQLRTGQTRPLSLPLSQTVNDAIIERVYLDYGVHFVQARRMGIESNRDVEIYLSANGSVSVDLVSDLKKLVNDRMEENVNVKVFVFKEADIINKDN